MLQIQFVWSQEPNKNRESSSESQDLVNDHELRRITQTWVKKTEAGGRQGSSDSARPLLPTFALFYHISQKVVTDGWTVGAASSWMHLAWVPKIQAEVFSEWWWASMTACNYLETLAGHFEAHNGQAKWEYQCMWTLRFQGPSFFYIARVKILSWTDHKECESLLLLDDVFVS